MYTFFLKELRTTRKIGNTHATEITENSFVANWDIVSGAEHYLIDLYTLIGDEEVEIFETFTNVKDGKPLPEGWTGNASGHYESSTNSKEPNSLAFKPEKGEEEYIQTCDYPAPVTELSFWYKFVSGGIGSTFKIEKKSNGIWSEIDIIEFVNSKLGGSVLMMGGLSLGGQILLEILSQRKDICKYAIVESVLVIPSKFTYSMIKPAFGSCYGLIKYKWFSKLQFKSLRIKSNLFDEYYKDTCAIRKSDMIAFLQENSVYSLKDGIGECEATVQIYVGEKEKQSMKKSAKIIHEKLQDSFIQVLPNMNHGEFSINHADDYVRKLLEIVKRR